MNDRRRPDNLVYKLGWLFWLLFASAVALNFATYQIQPTVWIDEAAYADPAINWAMGKGFVSSAWYAQPDHVFWAGNVPLYQVLLAGWMKILGVSEASVRLFGDLMGCAAVAIFVWAASRLLPFKSRGWMAGTFLLLLLADGSSFSYRSARPDALAMVLAALQLLAVSLPRKGTRRALLLATSMLAPWTALQLVLYLAFVWAAAIAMNWRKYWADAVLVGLGTAAGLAGLGLLYLWQGTLMDFWHSIRQHTAAGGSGGLDWKGWFLSPLVDRSSWVLLPLSIFLAGWGRSVHERRIWLPALEGLFSLLLVPWLMRVGGTYKLYYAWMALVPGILFLVASAQACGPRWLKNGTCLMFLVAILAGFPLRLFFSVLADPLPLKRQAMEMIVTELKPEDRVICHSKFYYPIRLKAEQVYSPSYLRRITREELASVNILVLDPQSGPWPEEERKEDWKEVSRLSSSNHEKLPLFLQDALRKYTAREINLPWDMVIYRRIGENAETLKR